MIGYFIQTSFWMSFSISLPHISSIFVSFYAFLYFIHKFLSHLKKIMKSFSGRDVLIKVVDFVFGYFDLEIFKFVLENTLKTPWIFNWENRTHSEGYIWTKTKKKGKQSFFSLWAHVFKLITLYVQNHAIFFFENFAKGRNYKRVTECVCCAYCKTKSFVSN